MAIHISARVAWHMDGWNGHICRDPNANCFCTGPHSYPGDVIGRKRDLAWELVHKGESCAKLDKVPPCVYSINAFGKESITASDEPPDFFKSGTAVSWIVPAATVCVWPYEAMYGEDAKTSGRYDNFKRLELAKQYFAPIECGKSLVFHYANYSNPFSAEDAQRYVIVGLSRIKALGEIEFYNNTDAETKEQFGGGFVWQRNVETHYPDQGLRIPYHRYADREEVLDLITMLPDNPRTCKYGTRHLTDDDALSLVERFIEVVTALQGLGDSTEDWTNRLTWLQGVLAELWRSRGLYPGLGKILDLLGMGCAVQPLQRAVSLGEEKEFFADTFAWLGGVGGLPKTVELVPGTEERIRRGWLLRSATERAFIENCLARIDLPREQMVRILSADRAQNGISSSLEEIVANPYLLTEQFVGEDADDIIPFSRVDHAVLPSPDLGGEPIFEPDDARRFRALCSDRLRFETKHAFLSCTQLLADINKRLGSLPEWKRAEFSEGYFDLDRELLEGALVLRREDGKLYAYLKRVYQAEREVEVRLRALASAPDITFKSPLTREHWKNLLYSADGDLAAKAREAYDEAIETQITVCSQVFIRPLSVICGSAGTGKTTAIRAVLNAIDKAHASSATFLLLAPTGKAADRMREKTGKPASTIHSFLAKLGWINENLTIKLEGGRKEDHITTFVVDEASMMHLELMAALCRAINWNAVQRLIIVGDPNQLPPIGRGRVFADTLEWLRAHHPLSVAELTVNLRQMENRIAGNGTGILDLAELYVRPASRDVKDGDAALRAEEMFQRIQDLPPDGSVDKDLRVLFWKDATDLKSKLTGRMIEDMESDSGVANDPSRPFDLWKAAAKGPSASPRPEYHQIISPYLHDEFGTTAINQHVQRVLRGTGNLSSLDGICLFDKVIQVKNRSGSSSLVAYNFQTKQAEPCDVFNGELGYVMPSNLDGQAWRGPNFRPRRFTVKFSRKDHLLYNYGSDLGYYQRAGKRVHIPDQKPEGNLELAYAISVHKAQGSEFERVYFVLTKKKAALLSPELFYTGITRASRHCTLLIEEDALPLFRMYRPEASHLLGINSSLFEFVPAPEGFETLRRTGFLEEYRIHRSLAEVMVRSKSEVIIANILFDREIPFEYEKQLYASDGTFHLPDFTILWHGETFYWEHLGMLSDATYRAKWEKKRTWYEANFPGRLLVTEESGELSGEAVKIVLKNFAQ